MELEIVYGNAVGKKTGNFLLGCSSFGAKCLITSESWFYIATVWVYVFGECVVVGIASIIVFGGVHVWLNDGIGAFLFLNFLIEFPSAFFVYKLLEHVDSFAFEIGNQADLKLIFFQFDFGGVLADKGLFELLV